jgi:pantoate--beta-alanine ligase
MRLLRPAAEMQAAALAWRAQGLRLALVPTMGALHEGHLSLVRLAREGADVVVVSIFVNPTQFGPREDFAAYPRELERDLSLCAEAGADAVFAPSVEDMYPAGHSVHIDETALSTHLCGAARPGHFRGVCTVVAKLFHLCLPHRAVFGEKDAQQLRVIRRLVRDLNFPVEIVAAPTAREADGLARSSRNRYLGPEERAAARVVPRALDAVAERVAAGERDPAVLRAVLAATVAAEPLARVDYLEVVDDETLVPATARLAQPFLVAVAVHIGRTRLIDNRRFAP